MDRAAPLDRAVRAVRRARAGRRARELLVVGEPPPSRGVPGAVPVPPGPLHAGGPGRAAEGRLRAVRRRLPHLHRDALRTARGADDRGRDPGTLPPGAGRPGPGPLDPADAYAVAALRSAGDRQRRAWRVAAETVFK